MEIVESTDDWAPLEAPDLVAEHARLREECPVAHSSLYGGYWSLNRYADVARAARDWQRFRSGVPFIPVPDFPSSIPLSINPPEHTFFRRSLNRFFSAGRMEAFSRTVATLVDDQLAPLLARGEGEFVTEFAEPLPARVLAAFLGMPDDAGSRLVDAQNEAIAASVAGDGEAVGRAVAAEISAVVDRRREQPLDPETDVISAVLALDMNGEPVGDEAVQGICNLLFLAGHSTTRDALSSALFFLVGDLELQARLRSEPGAIPDAIEEFLRLEPPLHSLGRTAAEDITLHDRTIREGELVGLNFAAANRDGAQFADPDACIIDRRPNRHLTFGHGIHKCLGMPLARVQLSVAIEALLEATTEVELVRPATRRESRPVAFGFDRLNIRLGASPTLTASDRSL